MKTNTQITNQLQKHTVAAKLISKKWRTQMEYKKTNDLTIESDNCRIHKNKLGFKTRYVVSVRHFFESAEEAKEMVDVIEEYLNEKRIKRSK